MTRYICIHGHFYQPPRENPWLEAIELQDEAYPFHDWNERITHECYAPNTASRILNEKGEIRKIVNNYARISFNFGPTLLHWMEKNDPETYKAVIESDRESMQRFSGHGSAIAQAYNHMIMPLANRRDKYTQVIWGIKDFEHRFGRKPEGMWLPETAVDMETLEIMAEMGIQFTILAPHQARRVRKIGSSAWHEVSPGGIDPSMPYRLHLSKSGRFINIFFYDAPIARAVAFEGLLSNGEHFARRLMSGFAEWRSWPQLVHIATDGETYGHHHRFGDMALAYALDYIENNKLARITNYSEYLEMHPPTHEVEIIENTSWSCAHGVERWRNNCGCNSGMHPGWSQSWRAPLRNALNWLRNTAASRYEEEGRRYFKDPWEARNDYISVILDRSAESLRGFLDRHAARALDPTEQITALKLLEMQRHAMLMFTSCGWFFDEISGIETVQILRYAGRLIQLCQEVFGTSYESPFLEILEQAKSNIPEHRNGAHVYEKFVKPSIVNLPKVGAHYAISSLFDQQEERSRIYCFTVERNDHRELEAGKAKLVCGRARVTSEITRESVMLDYGVLYFGSVNVSGGVRACRGDEEYQGMVRELSEAFERGDISGAFRILDKHFEGRIFTLRELFRDRQRKILGTIMESTLSEVEADYRRIYDNHLPLMRFLKDIDHPRPRALSCAAEFVLNTELRRKLSEEELDIERITGILNEAKALEIVFDREGLGYTLRRTIERLAAQLRSRPEDIPLLERLEKASALARSVPFEVDLWKTQNIYYKMLQEIYPEMKRRAERGDEKAEAWLARFNTLGDHLRVRRP